MSTLWQYEPGTLVTHVDFPEMRGIVTKCLTGEQAFGASCTTKEESEYPVYEISWVIVPEGKQPYIGVEPEGQLILLHQECDSALSLH